MLHWMLSLAVAALGLVAEPALANQAAPAACRFTLETGPAVVDPDGRPAMTWIVTCRPPAQPATAQPAKASQVETPMARRG